MSRECDCSVEGAGGGITGWWKRVVDLIVELIGDC